MSYTSDNHSLCGMECCEDPENPGSFFLRLSRQDLLLELMRCKNSQLVVCVVDTELLVYRVTKESFVDNFIEDEMVRDITKVLKAKQVPNGSANGQQTSIHIFTNTDLYDSAERVACELGIRVFCHRLHS